MQYTVEASAITKTFGDHRALDDVDLEIEGGSVFALLGPNGAGKTTMVRVLATLTRPDSGSATVAGHDLLADPMGVKRSISLTGQFAAVDDVLTGRENLDLMARLRRLPGPAARARTAELLETFELTDAADRRAGTYSGGMRRRLDLAISMIERPRLLFLDEPTTGLDPRSREQLWDTTVRLVEEGVTILLTTQYLEEADQLADTIAVLDRGRIVARGTAEELKARLGGATLRLRFADVDSLREAAWLFAAARVDERLRTLELPTDGSTEDVQRTLVRLVAADVASSEISIERPSLDDVFLHLTGGTAGRNLDHADLQEAV
jgi:ABC-2 type transport system ATP-binding protein